MISTSLPQNVTIGLLIETLLGPIPDQGISTCFLKMFKRATYNVEERNLPMAFWLTKIQSRGIYSLCKTSPRWCHWTPPNSLPCKCKPLITVYCIDIDTTLFFMLMYKLLCCICYLSLFYILLYGLFCYIKLKHHWVSLLSLLMQFWMLISTLLHC